MNPISTKCIVVPRSNNSDNTISVKGTFYYIKHPGTKNFCNILEKNFNSIFNFAFSSKEEWDWGEKIQRKVSNPN